MRSGITRSEQRGVRWLEGDWSVEVLLVRTRMTSTRGSVVAVALGGCPFLARTKGNTWTTRMEAEQNVSGSCPFEACEWTAGTFRIVSNRMRTSEMVITLLPPVTQSFSTTPLLCWLQPRRRLPPHSRSNQSERGREAPFLFNRHSL